MKAFRSFRLDPSNQCLWQGERRAPLTPKAFDVLRYLVEHPGRLVTQDEILEALWPETYVNRELIKKYILGIRKVLGDRPDKPEFIETFPKRGYQFVAAVSDEVAPGPQDLTTEPSKKMVGRDTALAELLTALRRALRGQRQVVFVTGEAGIGKTTLADAFHQQAVRSHTLRVGRGQCVEGFGGKEAYYPMLESLGPANQESGRQSPRSDHRKTCSDLADSVPSAGQSGAARRVATRDPRSHAGANGAGDLRSTRSNNFSGSPALGV